MPILGKIIKRLGEPDIGALVVTTVHNEFGHKPNLHGPKGFPAGRGNVVEFYPATWADPGRHDYLSNVLAVGSVDWSSRVSHNCPYQE